MRKIDESSSRITPTVFLVDDNPTVRDALGLFLESSELSVRTYPSAQAFLDDYCPEYPGCLILDIRMPGMSGMELQQYLLKRHITIPIHTGLPCLPGRGESLLPFLPLSLPCEHRSYGG